MKSPSVHHEEVVSLERELLTTSCRINLSRLEQLLHSDFREHGASGRTWSRSEVIDELPDSPQVDGTPLDLQSTDLAEGVVLLTYRLEGRRPSKRSSVWVFEEGRWQMLFHQGTLTAN